MINQPTSSSAAPSSSPSALSRRLFITSGMALAVTAISRVLSRKGALTEQDPASVLDTFPNGVTIGGVPLQVKGKLVPGSKQCLIILQMPPLPRRNESSQIISSSQSIKAYLENTAHEGIPYTADGTIDRQISRDLALVLEGLMRQCEGKMEVYMDDRTWGAVGGGLVEEIEDAIRKWYAIEESKKEGGKPNGYTQYDPKCNENRYRFNKEKANILLGTEALVTHIMNGKIKIHQIQSLSNPSENPTNPFDHPYHTTVEIGDFLKRCQRQDRTQKGHTPLQFTPENNIFIMTPQTDLLEKSIGHHNNKWGHIFSHVILTPQSSLQGNCMQYVQRETATHPTNPPFSKSRQ